MATTRWSSRSSGRCRYLLRGPSIKKQQGRCGPAARRRPDPEEIEAPHQGAQAGFNRPSEDARAEIADWTSAFPAELQGLARGRFTRDIRKRRRLEQEIDGARSKTTFLGGPLQGQSRLSGWLRTVAASQSVIPQSGAGPQTCLSLRTGRHPGSARSMADALHDFRSARCHQVAYRRTGRDLAQSGARTDSMLDILLVRGWTKPASADHLCGPDP